MVGQEICIWGTDVENTPSASDPAPKGIVGYAIAPVASIGCAELLTTTSASFVMPGEGGSLLPNPATLTLPLSKPAGAGCVRIAIDAAGNPVAVVIPRAVTAPASAPPPSVSSLPGTSAEDDRAPDAFVFAAGGAFAAAIAPSFVAEGVARYHRDGRARRGASGALYPQSALAGLNPLPRSGIADPACARRR